MEIIWQPLINLLMVFYHILFGNLGLAVIIFTGFLRLLLVPLTHPSLKSMHKMKLYTHELAAIRAKYPKDKTKQMQAQADFYKSKGINPAAGCLPQLVQIVILIALFNGFSTVFMSNGDIVGKLNNFLYPPLRVSGQIDHYFLGRDLTKPDVYNIPGIPLPLPGLFLIFSALVQVVSSKMMAPDVAEAKKLAKKTKGETDDIATVMQQQMLYFFPIITIVIGYQFPLILILYWGALSLFQAIQQYFVSGWGGLGPWLRRVNLVKYTPKGKNNG